MRTLCGLLVTLAIATAQESKSPLLGEWSVIDATGDGLAKTLKDNVSTIAIDDGKLTAGRAADYTYDAKAMTIDMTIAGGPKAEEGKYLGVFEVKNKELKLHFAMPGKPRPTGFTAGPGTFVITLKKR